MGVWARPDREGGIETGDGAGLGDRPDEGRGQRRTAGQEMTSIHRRSSCDSPLTLAGPSVSVSMSRPGELAAMKGSKSRVLARFSMIVIMASPSQC